MRDFFRELPGFLQDYVTRNHWSGFREVQQRSFEVLFDTEDHLLITAGTSSGKTEAAMFPVVSSMYWDPPKSIGALYISPLKALIDDQFDRVDDIIRDADIKVTSWHGDVSQSVKKGLMRQPSGIMQTTPESLQSLLINHRSDAENMFSDLRFIIIDEVHSFMNSTRGLQLLCELETIERLTGCRPRRIGLSATLSDITLATSWLRGNDSREVSIVSCGGSVDGSIILHYNRFTAPGKDEEPLDVRKKKDEARRDAILEYYNTVFKETDPYNCLVFTNSRLDAEKMTRSLRAMSSRSDRPKDVEIHHGSLSKEIRKDSEYRIKNSQLPVTLVSTSTLELGIDIGNIERVVQKDPPYSCSSFVQRMGRSGRRTGVPVMRMFCTTDELRLADLPQRISINLLKGIAMVELYLRERWVEPVRYSSCPYGLLYQQTMAYIKAYGGVPPEDLFNDVLSMYPFRYISPEDYTALLKHLVQTGHIGFFDGYIVLQQEGERVVNSADFLATFSDDNRFEVVCNGKPIGFMPKKPKPSETIILAGRSWKVKGIKGMEIDVEGINLEGSAKWDGGEPFTHERIVSEIRMILGSDKEYDYLDEKAVQELRCCRNYARETELLSFFSIGPMGTVHIHPWGSSTHFDVLVRILKTIDNAHIVGVEPPFTISVATYDSPERLMERISQFINEVDPSDLIKKSDILAYEKFDQYAPVSLLKRKFVTERIDLDIPLLRLM